jgi:hypothetical protein
LIGVIVADCGDEFRFELVNLDLVGHILEDRDRPEKFVSHAHRGKAHRNHFAVFERDLIGEGFIGLGRWRVVRPLLNRLHPRTRRPPKQTREFIDRFSHYLVTVQPQNGFGRFVEQGNGAAVVSDQYAVCHACQHGCRAAGFNLLGAQHGAQIFRLVADELEKLAVVDGHRKLVGGCLQQIQLIRRKVPFFAVIKQQGSQRVLAHNERRADRAFMQGVVGLADQPALIFKQVWYYQLFPVLDHPPG